MTALVCGHCNAIMVREPAGLRCSAKCKKAGRKNVQQWRTREGRVVNVKHMDVGHLHAAIAYLERNGRTGGVGYGWLVAERTRRGLDAPVKHAPPPPRPEETLQCGACGATLIVPEGDTRICQCGQMVWRKVVAPPEPVPLPKGRGINLKGVPE